MQVDVRVLVATYENLEEAVRDGRLREDLYYRLNVHIVRVPPLRERRSDVPELIDHFLVHTCERFGIRTKRIDPAAKDALAGCEWRRNNVRELRNIIEERVIPGVSMEHLSMGMTNDYEVAIEEGATIVRVGRAIFGERG